MTRLDDDVSSSFVNASTKTILKKAKEVVEAEVAKSTIFESLVEEKIPRFDSSEIKLGRVVGRGGFCVVREITEIRLRAKNENGSTAAAGAPASSDKESARGWWRKRHGTAGTTSLDSTRSHRSLASIIDTENALRGFLARKVWFKKGGKYVIKQVNSDLIHSDKVTFLKGIIDITLESKFLASLNHPNIIKLQAECRTSPFEGTDYFLVLDHMPEMLPKRLNAWMHAKRATRGVTGFVIGSKRKVRELMTERLLVAYDIASACAYLHDNKNVIFRDLKPDNIGFDANGVTKLMDFGLAKELTNEEKDENGLYHHLTGLTGGIRYMAPEVGLSMPYNLKADIYSWSMIMWYVMALEPPFLMFSPDMFTSRVFVKGYRPATKEKWSPSLCHLLKLCWSEDLYERPSFKEIKAELRKEVHLVDPQVAVLMELTSDDQFVSNN